MANLIHQLGAIIEAKPFHETVMQRRPRAQFLWTQHGDVLSSHCARVGRRCGEASGPVQTPAGEGLHCEGRRQELGRHVPDGAWQGSPSTNIKWCNAPHLRTAPASAAPRTTRSLEVSSASSSGHRVLLGSGVDRVSSQVRVHVSHWAERVKWEVCGRQTCERSARGWCRWHQASNDEGNGADGADLAHVSGRLLRGGL